MSAISTVNVVSIAGRMGNSPAPLGDPSSIVKALGFLPAKGYGPPGSCFTLALDAATTGRLPAYTDHCTGGSGVGFGTQVGIVAKGSLISAGLSAIPVVGGLLASFSGLFSGAHHAAAVANERAALCSAVPEANGFLLQIDQAILAGQITTDDAVTAMEGAHAQFLKEVAPVYQEGSNKCNAACINAKFFRAAIEKRKQDYVLQGNSAARGSKGFQGQSAVASGLVGNIETVFQKPASFLINAGIVPASCPFCAVVLVVVIAAFGSYGIYRYFNGR